VACVIIYDARLYAVRSPVYRYDPYDNWLIGQER